MFKGVEVKFVRIANINKNTGSVDYADTVMEWRPGMLFVYDEPDWERLRHIKL
jgi:hypothetical protein